MNCWWVLVIGFLAGAPVWIALSAWLTRRVWRSTRRISARTKGREHLTELAQLAGGLAHEIKNPLSTINMNLKLLAEDLARSRDEDHQRWLRRLQHVQDETARLRDILDDFLHFARGHELNLETVPLQRIVGELVDFFTPQAEAAGVVIRTSLAEEPVRCRVDVDLLKQAVLNLMINAVQAMEPEGGELMIRVDEARGRGVIEVIDTGPGMPPEIRRRIFEVYYSTKKNGSGLGLPTTRRIVEEHHGSIRAESEPEKGTRFILHLPLAES